MFGEDIPSPLLDSSNCRQPNFSTNIVPSPLGCGNFDDAVCEAGVQQGELGSRQMIKGGSKYSYSMLEVSPEFGLVSGLESLTR